MTENLPYIPFADCAEVVMRGQCGGTEVVFTIGVKKDGELSDGDLDDIYDLFDTWWQTNLRGSIGDDFELLAIKVTNLSSQFAATYEAAPSANPGGSVSGTIAPNNAAQIVTFQTEKRGRSYRGRNYLPAIPSANLLDANHITTAAAAANASAYTALGTLLGGAGYQHVVLSRYENKVRRTVGTATPVRSYVAKTLIATQRRRILGSGS